MSIPAERDVDMGLGKCSCGRWAVVGFQAAPVCLGCFKVGLARIREMAALLKGKA